MFEAFENKVATLPQLIMENSLRHDVDEIIYGLWPDKKLAVVDDKNTAEASGEKIFKALRSRFECAHLTHEGALAATDEACQWLLHELDGVDALVAVGSGSINDVCKYVSHKLEKPYLVVPTAASMNGYVSANASIKVQGYKTTLPGQMPAAVLCDMGVITTAPLRLNKSGVGDALARPTAQADWLLSHLMLGTEYDTTGYDALQEYEDRLFAGAGGVAKADGTCIRHLMQVLLLGGMAMTAAGGSFPVSQGEHMIAHTYGMMKSTQPLPQTFHGEEVGVTALTMAQLQEKLLQKKATPRQDAFDEKAIKKLFGNKIAGDARAAFAQKAEQVEKSGAQDKDWQDIAGKVAQIVIDPMQLKQVLQELEAPAMPDALGWKTVQYDTAIQMARFMRERFTFLDMV